RADVLESPPGDLELVRVRRPQHRPGVRARRVAPGRGRSRPPRMGSDAGARRDRAEREPVGLRPFEPDPGNTGEGNLSACHAGRRRRKRQKDDALTEGRLSILLSALAALLLAACNGGTADTTPGTSPDTTGAAGGTLR